MYSWSHITACVFSRKHSESVSDSRPRETDRKLKSATHDCTLREWVPWVACWARECRHDPLLFTKLLFVCVVPEETMKHSHSHLFRVSGQLLSPKLAELSTSKATNAFKTHLFPCNSDTCTKQCGKSDPRPDFGWSLETITMISSSIRNHIRHALVVGVDWSNQQNLVIEPNFMA